MCDLSSYFEIFLEVVILWLLAWSTGSAASTDSPVYSERSRWSMHILTVIGWTVGMFRRLSMLLVCGQIRYRKTMVEAPIAQHSSSMVLLEKRKLSRNKSFCPSHVMHVDFGSIVLDWQSFDWAIPFVLNGAYTGRCTRFPKISYSLHSSLFTPGLDHVMNGMVKKIFHSI